MMPDVATRMIRYSERPELWESWHDGAAAEVWPEYNQHLAEGHTAPVRWDGTDAGLGPGIDAMIANAFRTQETGEAPTAVTALAAEIPHRHQGRRLSGVMLGAMKDLASQAGLSHLIAPVRPNLKDRYPTIPIERYASWTRPDGSPFEPWMRMHTKLGARIGPAFPRSMHITGTVGDWESWTGMAQ
jgi:hypothetical protein